jgi:hypothetical protein
MGSSSCLHHAASEATAESELKHETIASNDRNTTMKPFTLYTDPEFPRLLHSGWNFVSYYVAHFRKYSTCARKTFKDIFLKRKKVKLLIVQLLSLNYGPLE